MLKTSFAVNKLSAGMYERFVGFAFKTPNFLNRGRMAAKLKSGNGYWRREEDYSKKAQ